MTTLPTIFQLCRPRDDVLHGELRDDIFAARLQQVVAGQADPIYQDPRRFFENTYPTSGLKSLLTEALGRLTGARPQANPILRLETSFGGGKTHNLIALYHAAQGHLPADLATRFVPADLLPKAGEVRIAAIAGNALDPATGTPRGNGIVVRTPWGELAYQLGGAAGYARVRANDEQGVPPGTALWEALIGDRPTLILIDEIARFMRAAKRAAAGKHTLAEQVAPFLMALLEFAASQPHVVVVLTLAADDDAFAQETADLLQELRKITARQERVLTPAEEDELPAIVTHRLFADVNHKAAEPVFLAYLEAYRTWEEQKTALPAKALRADYHTALQRAYPFHPELLYILSHKVATIPNFQRTRGALRLLARVVRALWATPDAPVPMIHPHHLDFADPEIVGDLTSRLERPKFQQVIEADIVSRSGAAHAQVADRDWAQAGKPPYTQRVAKAAFLHSLVQSGPSGVRPDELHLAVLEPGDDPTLVKKALEHLEDKAWFFEFDGHRYRFKTEPSLNKIILDEMSAVGRLRAKAHLDQRIQRMWPSGLVQVVFFPREPGDVPERAEQPQLVILHYDAAKVPNETAEQPPDMVRRIFKYSGALEAHRVYANYLAFLVADADQIKPMVQQAQRELAIQRLLDDSDRLQEFTKEQVRRLRKMRDAAKLDVAVAIARCYRHLYFPSAEAPAEHDRLAHVPMPAQEQGNVQQDQVAVVVRVLREHNKALTHDDPPKSAYYLKARAWPQGRDRLSTRDLYRTFAQSLRLPWLLDPNQLRRSIRNGIERGVWVYYDARTQQAYDALSLPPSIEISEDTYLYLPEAARQAGLLQPLSSAEISDGIPDTTPTADAWGSPSSSGHLPPLRQALATEAFPVQQAFTRLQDLAQEAQISRLAGLQVSLERSAPKPALGVLRSLAAALPLFPAGERHIALHLSFTTTAGADLELRGRLPDKDFRPLVQALTPLLRQAGDAELELTLTLQPAKPLDFQTLQNLAETLDPLGIGELALRAEPANEDEEGA